MARGVRRRGPFLQDSQGGERGRAKTEANTQRGGRVARRSLHRNRPPHPRGPHSSTPLAHVALHAAILASCLTCSLPSASPVPRAPVNWHRIVTGVDSGTNAAAAMAPPQLVLAGRTHKERPAAGTGASLPQTFPHNTQSFSPQAFHGPAGKPPWITCRVLPIGIVRYTAAGLWTRTVCEAVPRRARI